MSGKSIDELTLLALAFLHDAPEATALGVEIQECLGLREEEAEEVVYFLEESEFVECDHESDRADLNHSYLHLTSRGRLHLERKTRVLGGDRSERRALRRGWGWGLAAGALLIAALILGLSILI